MNQAERRRLGDGRPKTSASSRTTPISGHLGDPAGPDEAAVDAHDSGDRDGAEHGEGAPRAAASSAFTTTSASTASKMMQISRMPITGDGAGDRAQFGADHVAERAAVAAGRQEQHDDSCTAPAKTTPKIQSVPAVSHLRREHRADQRACTGDGREVVAEQDSFIGGQ